MNYFISEYSELSSALYNEWRDAWDQSTYSHVFNSPYWFEACHEAEPGHELLMLVCRDQSDQILGILPLIKGKKFGFSVYLSPGHKYLDKSSLFVTDGSPAVCLALLDALRQRGSYYLTEVNELLANEVSQKRKAIGISQCSEGRDLEISEDPLCHLSRENRRRLLKRIREDKNLSYVQGSVSIKESISIARDIEVNSSKTKERKDIFSDPFLLALCEYIEKLKPGILKFTFLYHNHEPICYKYGYLTRTIYHYSNTAYTWSHQKLSPGRLLMILTLRELQNTTVKQVDFSRGDTPFKREFSTSLYRQYTLFQMNNIMSMWVWRAMYAVKRIIKL